MKLSASLMDSLKGILQAEAGKVSKAAEAAVRESGQALKEDLRRQVTGAGLGGRLARAWRERTYPNRGSDAASLVWTKAPRIVRAFDEGTVIKGRNGLWLAIPTPAAPKRGVGGKRINPSNFPEHRYGPLRFVYRRSGPSLLVVDAVRVNAATGRVGRRAKGGATTRTGRMKAGMATVVMFLLVPQVRMPKRLDVARAARRAEIRLAANLVKHLDAADGQGRTA